MIRWRTSLLLAMLLLLPARIGSKGDDEGEEDESNRNPEEENEETEGDEDDDAEDPAVEKTDVDPGRKGPSLIPTPKTIPITRTTSKRPLECYVCAYKSDRPIKSCLDPSKFRVHSMTCHGMEEKCFTTVMAKGGALEGVVRGCRSGCVGTQDTTCCDSNHCNSGTFPMPIISPHALAANKTTKSIPTTVLFFVTILLVLQTVVKVAFV